MHRRVKVSSIVVCSKHEHAPVYAIEPHHLGVKVVALRPPTRCDKEYSS